MSLWQKATGIVLIGITIMNLRATAGQDAGAKPDADMTAVAEGNTHFALELYGRLREQKGNLFLSPLSLSTVLAMTYAGARGETATEMAGVLHFDLPAERLHPAFAKLLADLDVKEGQPPYRLYVANALWADQKHKFLPEFVARAKTNYGAGVQAVDFEGALEPARQTINTWVADQTQGKIPELIGPGVLTPATVLVLTNAIYFKGDWVTKFDKAKTADAPFTRADGKTAPTPMMNQTTTFGYFERPTFQMLELPYAGDVLSMIILLPRQSSGLVDLEKTLDANALADWLSKLARQDVQVALPRFTMTGEFRLDQVLQAMGMRAAFRAADFSGMDGTKSLFIGAVIHKAFVDVNEEGTEAAGASGVAMMKSAMRPAPVFRADHPFLFLVRDKRTGSILFIGRVENPKP
jgi:serpin B